MYSSGPVAISPDGTSADACLERGSTANSRATMGVSAVRSRTLVGAGSAAAPGWAQSKAVRHAVHVKPTEETRSMDSPCTGETELEPSEVCVEYRPPRGPTSS